MLPPPLAFSFHGRGPDTTRRRRREPCSSPPSSAAASASSSVLSEGSAESILRRSRCDDLRSRKCSAWAKKHGLGLLFVLFVLFFFCLFGLHRLGTAAMPPTCFRLAGAAPYRFRVTFPATTTTIFVIDVLLMIVLLLFVLLMSAFPPASERPLSHPLSLEVRPVKGIAEARIGDPRRVELVGELGGEEQDLDK